MYIYIYIHIQPNNTQNKTCIKKQQTLPPYVSTASTGTAARAETDIGPSSMATLEWDEAVGGWANPSEKEVCHNHLKQP